MRDLSTRVHRIGILCFDQSIQNKENIFRFPTNSNYYLLLLFFCFFFFFVFFFCCFFFVFFFLFCFVLGFFIKIIPDQNLCLYAL